MEEKRQKRLKWLAIAALTFCVVFLFVTILLVNSSRDSYNRLKDENDKIEDVLGEKQIQNEDFLKISKI